MFNGHVFFKIWTASGDCVVVPCLNTKLYFSNLIISVTVGEIIVNAAVL